MSWGWALGCLLAFDVWGAWGLVNRRGHGIGVLGYFW